MIRNDLPKKVFVLITLIACAFLIIMLTQLLLSDGIFGNSHIQSQKYELHNEIVYDQLFYGKWKIVNYVASDISLPSSYAGFDENGDFKGVNYSTILGQEIYFGDDFVEYLGSKYELAYGPLTYTHVLLSEEQLIGYNYAKTLGIKGEYYSIVYFLLPDNYRVIGFEQNRPKEIFIEDLCFLYLKDYDTIFASDGILTYLLERLPT